MTESECRVIITNLANLYPQIKNAELLANSYHRMIGKFDYLLSYDACIELVKTSKFFPSPPDVYQACKMANDQTTPSNQLTYGKDEFAKLDELMQKMKNNDIYNRMSDEKKDWHVAKHFFPNLSNDVYEKESNKLVFTEVRDRLDKCISCTGGKCINTTGGYVGYPKLIHHSEGDYFQNWMVKCR